MSALRKIIKDSELNVAEEDIKKIYRIGRPAEGKLRPMIVALTKLETKEKILSGKKKYFEKNPQSKIKYEEDLTKGQYQRLGELYKEANNRNEDIKLEGQKWIVKGPKSMPFLGKIPI